jgi:hypothetical protein
MVVDFKRALELCANLLPSESLRLFAIVTHCEFYSRSCVTEKDSAKWMNRVSTSEKWNERGDAKLPPLSEWSAASLGRDASN